VAARAAGGKRGGRTRAPPAPSFSLLVVNCRADARGSTDCRAASRPLLLATVALGRMHHGNGRKRSSATSAALVFVGIEARRSSTSSACSISVLLSVSEVLGAWAAPISCRHSLARAATVAPTMATPEGATR